MYCEISIYRTFLSIGCCPYRDRCSYIHDPRLASHYSKSKSRKKGPDDSKSVDIFFWPLNELNQTSNQYYDVPCSSQISFVQLNDIYDDCSSFLPFNSVDALYSMWNHFIDTLNTCQTLVQHSKNMPSELYSRNTPAVSKSTNTFFINGRQHNYHIEISHDNQPTRRYNAKPNLQSHGDIYDSCNEYAPFNKYSRRPRLAIFQRMSQGVKVVTVSRYIAPNTYQSGQDTISEMDSPCSRNKSYCYEQYIYPIDNNISNLSKTSTFNEECYNSTATSPTTVTAYPTHYGSSRQQKNFLSNSIYTHSNNKNNINMY